MQNSEFEWCTLVLGIQIIDWLLGLINQLLINSLTEILPENLNFTTENVERTRYLTLKTALRFQCDQFLQLKTS